MFLCEACSNRMGVSFIDQVLALPSRSPCEDCGEVQVCHDINTDSLVLPLSPTSTGAPPVDGKEG